MPYFKSLINIHKGRNFLIPCTGKNTGVYIDKIKEFAENMSCVTLGMNTASRLIFLNYHLFTNNDRIKNYISEVNAHSELLIGSHVKEENRPNRDHTLVKYTDRDPTEAMDYNNDTIYGYYRVSGLLAIMIAHLMGASKIYITGKDGFSYNCENNNGYVHFHKDDRNNKNNNKTKEEWWERYDKPMIQVMKNLRSFGIDFSIITPTVFQEIYEEGVL